LAVLTLVSLRAGVVGAETTRYSLVPQVSRVVVHVGKAGLFGFAGHEHQIVAGPVAGTVVVDTESVARSTVEVRFDASGLRVTGQGEPQARRPEGPGSDARTAVPRRRPLPTIRFVSKTVTVTRASGGHYDLVLRGDLTLHGVTRAVVAPVSVDLVGERLMAQGRVAIRQTDFGITPITVAGVVKVKDEVVLEWTLEGRR